MGLKKTIFVYLKIPSDLKNNRGRRQILLFEDAIRKTWKFFNNSFFLAILEGTLLYKIWPHKINDFILYQF